MIKKVSIATLAMFLTSASPAMAISDAHSLYVNLELTFDTLCQKLEECIQIETFNQDTSENGKNILRSERTCWICCR